MKNILRVFTRDLKKIFTNWVAIIILCGLIILPATYAWFNIKASWDPYGSTNGIKIAVVNNDNGTEFKNTTINIGDKLVKELSTNKQIGWIFTDEKKAERGVKRGTYFASIVIPESFSNNLVSPLNKTIAKPELVYTVNESANAIAPKITDKGVASIKEKVDKTVTETVNGAIFKVMNELGIQYVSNQDKVRTLIDAVYTLNDNLPQIEELISQAYSGAISLDLFNKKINAIIPNFETTLNDINDTLNSGKNVVNKTKDNINTIAPLIKEDLIIANNILERAISLLENISKEDALNILQTVNTKIQAVEKTVDANIKLLESINKILHNDQLVIKIEKLKQAQSILQEIETEINKAIEDINNGGVLDSAIQSIKTKIENLNSLLSSIIANYDTTIMPAINASLDKLDKIASESSTLIQDTQNVLPDVKIILGKLSKGTQITQNELGIVKEKFPAFKQSFGDLTQKIRKLDNEDDINKIIDLIVGDWKERASFIANPIEVQTNKLFSVPNYGSAMSPFYTTLALWVGCLILISILTLNPKPLEEGVPLKPLEKYFGKYLLFAFIAILQGATVTLGDIFILKTYVLNPTYFVLFGMLTSFIFVTIVYSTVSVFGNVGKAICIIFLVLQVAASGGTFPVEVMSGFFQAINPYLPFKYAIEAMRGLVGGIVPELIQRDIAVLLLFAVGFMVFALLTKGKINILADKFHKKASESGILEH